MDSVIFLFPFYLLLGHQPGLLPSDLLSKFSMHTIYHVYTILFVLITTLMLEKFANYGGLDTAGAHSFDVRSIRSEKWVNTYVNSVCSNRILRTVNLL